MGKKEFSFLFLILAFCIALAAFCVDLFGALFYDFGLVELIGKFLVYVLCLYQLSCYLLGHDMVAAYGQPVGVDRSFERMLYAILYVFLLGVASAHSITHLSQRLSG